MKQETFETLFSSDLGRFHLWRKREREGSVKTTSSMLQSFIHFSWLKTIAQPKFYSLSTIAKKERKDRIFEVVSNIYLESEKKRRRIKST